jgi:hypothetical protein
MRGNGKFCSLGCATKYGGRKRTKQVKAIYDRKPKLCAQCKLPIVWGKHRTNSFCSQTCSARHNNGMRPKKERISCLKCNKSFDSRHRKVRCCSQACSRAYKLETSIEDWLAGKESGSTLSGGIAVRIKKYVLKTSNHKCKRCGWRKKNSATGNYTTQIEHIDGDYSNNRPENLIVLCPNCHSLTPTYGSLNRGNGRDSRQRQRLNAVKLSRA